MTLAQLIEKQKAEREFLSKVDAAIKSDAFDLMKLDGLEGEDINARTAELSQRRADYDKLSKSIEELQAFNAPDPVEEPEVQKAQESAPVVYAQAKDVVTDVPSEFAKAMFDNADLRDWAVGNKGTFIKTIDNQFDLVKATLTSAGTIQAAPVATAVTTPLDVMDTLYILPWGSEVYRRRTVPRTTPQSVAVDTAPAESSAVVTPTDFPLQTISATQPIANRAIMADPTVMGAIAGMLIEDLRVALQGQVLSGNGTSPQLSGLPAQLGAAVTSDIAANTNILNAATDGLEELVLTVRGRGGMANYVYMNAADLSKAYSSLVAQHSSFMRDKQTPYGSPMGASLVLAPQLPADTAIIASMGNPRYHVVPVMGTIQVEISRDTEFEQDNTVMKATIYATSVVQNPDAFQEITSTDNYRVDE